MTNLATCSATEFELAVSQYTLLCTTTLFLSPRVADTNQHIDLPYHIIPLKPTQSELPHSDNLPSSVIMTKRPKKAAKTPAKGFKEPEKHKYHDPQLSDDPLHEANTSSLPYMSREKHNKKSVRPPVLFHRDTTNLMAISASGTFQNSQTLQRTRPIIVQNNI
jgi:hypothetical protein